MSTHQHKTLRVIIAALVVLGGLLLAVFILLIALLFAVASYADPTRAPLMLLAAGVCCFSASLLVPLMFATRRSVHVWGLRLRPFLIFGLASMLCVIAAMNAGRGPVVDDCLRLAVACLVLATLTFGLWRTAPPAQELALTRPASAQTLLSSPSAGADGDDSDRTNTHG